MWLQGPWPEWKVASHLKKFRGPLRLACRADEEGPRVVSLWFLWEGGAIWCATQETAQVARWLREDGCCGFEVAGDEPPYRGVRGVGAATLHDDRARDVLERLIDRYLDSRDDPLARWLLSRPGETAIRIEPERISSWDYTERMSRSREGPSR